MAQDTTGEYYTVAQAAEALGVSVSTIWRWIKAQRLPALRLGPKSIRVRRQDVEAELRHVATASRFHVIRTDPRDIRPLTAEEANAARAVFARMDANREAIFRRRKGRLLPDSTALIRSEREKRSRRI
jgi:excisionase family DNA binding protein